MIKNFYHLVAIKAKKNKKNPFDMSSSEFNDFCQIEGIS
jgi:regulator of sigma D